MRWRSTRVLVSRRDALRQVEVTGPLIMLGVGAGAARPASSGCTARGSGSSDRLVTKRSTACSARGGRGGTIDLDEPAGPPGSTIRHLLAHASGLPFEADTDRPARSQARVLEPGHRARGGDRGGRQRCRLSGISAAVLDRLGSVPSCALHAADLWLLDDYRRFAAELHSTLAWLRRRHWSRRLPFSSPEKPACCPTSAASTRWTGDSASGSSKTASNRTGRARERRRDLRPLRRLGDVPLGRPRCRPRPLLPDRPRVRPWALEAWPKLSDAVIGEAASQKGHVEEQSQGQSLSVPLIRRPRRAGG